MPGDVQVGVNASLADLPADDAAGSSWMAYRVADCLDSSTEWYSIVDIQADGWTCEFNPSCEWVVHLFDEKGFSQFTARANHDSPRDSEIYWSDTWGHPITVKKWPFCTNFTAQICSSKLLCRGRAPPGQCAPLGLQCAPESSREQSLS